MIPLAWMKRYCCLINCHLFQLTLLVLSRNTKTQTHTYTFNSVIKSFKLLVFILLVFKSFLISNTYTTDYNWSSQLGAKVVHQTIEIYPIKDFLQYLLLIIIIIVIHVSIHHYHQYKLKTNY